MNRVNISEKEGDFYEQRKKNQFKKRSSYNTRPRIDKQDFWLNEDTSLSYIIHLAQRLEEKFNLLELKALNHS